MAIEVDIPVEIDEYKEKIIFGMSLRQLACFSVAVVLSIGSYFVCTKILGMSMDATSYVIIAEALPLMALGFVQKDGQPFEKFFALMIRHKLGLHKLTLTTSKSSGIERESTTPERNKRYAWFFEGKAKEDESLTRSKRREKRRIREAIVFQADKKTAKRNRKAARQKIKAAQKEYRAAKRKANQESKAASST